MGVVGNMVAESWSAASKNTSGELEPLEGVAEPDEASLGCRKPWNVWLAADMIRPCLAASQESGDK